MARAVVRPGFTMQARSANTPSTVVPRRVPERGRLRDRLRLQDRLWLRHRGGHGLGASLRRTSGAGPQWTTPSRWVALVIATYRSLRPRGDSPRIWAGSAISTESVV